MAGALLRSQSSVKESVYMDSRHCKGLAHMDEIELRVYVFINLVAKPTDFRETVPEQRGAVAAHRAGIIGCQQILLFAAEEKANPFSCGKLFLPCIFRGAQNSQKRSSL